MGSDGALRTGWEGANRDREAWSVIESEGSRVMGTRTSTAL